MTLYFSTSLIYLLFAAIIALANASYGFEFLNLFSGLRWLRVHMITLGVVTQSVFAVLPALAAGVRGQPAPRARLDVWLLLNTGIIGLLVGIPIVNTTIIAIGGTLVFIATLILVSQISQGKSASERNTEPSGRRFYLLGLGFFLIGITIGAGLWTGLPAALAIKTPGETHIHANTWGLMSLLFAGLIVDLFPKFSGKSLAWPASINNIFWMMAFGATGLLLWPWTGSKLVAAPGLILHFTSTIWLLVNIIKPLREGNFPRNPGTFHLITAYVWFFAPLFFAPLLLFQVEGLNILGIEQNLPQAIIYGWVLQFSFAVLPFLFERAFGDPSHAKLGGNWFSFAAVHLGGVALVASIFFTPSYGLFYGIAYTLWGLSLLPIFWQLLTIVQKGEEKRAGV